MKRAAYAALAAAIVLLTARDATATEIVGAVQVTALVAGTCVFETTASSSNPVSVKCVKGMQPQVATTSVTLGTVRAILAQSGTSAVGLTGLPSAWTLVSVDL